MCQGPRLNQEEVESGQLLVRQAVHVASREVNNGPAKPTTVPQNDLSMNPAAC